MSYHRLVQGVTTSRAIANDVCLLAGIFILLLWPWVFLTIIWSRDGIQMDNHVAKVVKDYPQRTSFFITFLGNIVSIIISIIFSTAVVRFSQKWTTNNNHVTVFDVSLISAFQNQKWPWGIKDHKYLLVRNRWLPAVLAGVCIASFALVPSGTTSLITPVPFNRRWPLTGTELDFSSNAADCINWFAEIPSLSMTRFCGWKVGSLSLNECLTNHGRCLSEFQWSTI